MTDLFYVTTKLGKIWRISTVTELFTTRNFFAHDRVGHVKAM